MMTWLEVLRQVTNEEEDSSDSEEGADLLECDVEEGPSDPGEDLGEPGQQAQHEPGQQAQHAPGQQAQHAPGLYSHITQSLADSARNLRPRG